MTSLVTIQMIIEDGYPDRNIKHIHSLIGECEINEGDIVCLPELINTGYDSDCIGKLTESDSTEFATNLSLIAKKKKIWLIAGSITEATGNIRYNTSYTYAPNGFLIGKYRKIHLFSPINENAYFRSGNKSDVVQCGEIPIGNTICYDLRFPELYRRLMLNGAQVIINPSEWPAARRFVLRILSQARAVENQCYFMSCNRGGIDKGGIEYGGSLIVDPFGEILAEANGSAETILKAEFDLERLKCSRLSIPCLRERRPDVYQLDFEIAQDILANEFNEL